MPQPINEETQSGASLGSILWALGTFGLPNNDSIKKNFHMKIIVSSSSMPVVVLAEQ